MGMIKGAERRCWFPHTRTSVTRLQTWASASPLLLWTGTSLASITLRFTSWRLAEKCGALSSADWHALVWPKSTLATGNTSWTCCLLGSTHKASSQQSHHTGSQMQLVCLVFIHFSIRSTHACLSDQNFTLYIQLYFVIRNSEGFRHETPFLVFLFVAGVFCGDFPPLRSPAELAMPRSILFASLQAPPFSSTASLTLCQMRSRLDHVSLPSLPLSSRFPLCVPVHVPTAVSVPVMWRQGSQ